MVKQDLMDYLRAHTKFVFSRSSGPGGQNVNKLNTKVQASLSLSNADFFSEEELAQIRLKLKNRINNWDNLVVQVQEERKQAFNKEIALKKMTEAIWGAIAKRKNRIHTKPTKTGVENRLQAKKIRSLVKIIRKDTADW